MDARPLIPTTHVGSLPRPDSSGPHTSSEGESTVPSASDVDEAVREIVRRQVQAGIDIVNDGEIGKPSYVGYVTDRLTGFDDETVVGKDFMGMRDLEEFPSYFRTRFRRLPTAPSVPVCSSAVTYRGHSAVDGDIRRLVMATDSSGATQAFVTSASPGIIALSFPNRFYSSHEQYVAALAEAMREEYEAIAAAGFYLQIDCPDLAMGRQMVDGSIRDFRRFAEIHITALNDALALIPPERLRMHVCWGNYEGPHHRDVDLSDVLDIVFRARPSVLSLESSNPRHGHEWELFQERGLPDEKLLMPGLIDTTTNFIEHPGLVAQRLRRWVKIVGPERLIASPDCGFSSIANRPNVDPEIAWAKLRSMSDGVAMINRDAG